MKPKGIFLHVYSWPLNNTVELICRFIQYSHPSVPIGFASMESTNHQWKTIISISSWESVEWSANCMHCLMLFYIRVLIIHGFWYPREVLEPIPHGYQGLTVVKFWGVKSYVQISDYITFVLFKGQLYFQSTQITNHSSKPTKDCR